jgi:D-alanyl-D-alanine carboxypeptidase/D-alanyl-D-alanine-endopeptidase (penicillin-binding protein 4)
VAEEARASSGDVCALASALSAPEFRGARVGALVVRARDGEVLFARDADATFTPASNQKVLTALAALARLGPAHRFVTEVLADAEPDAAGRVGTLVLRGGGDPALVSEEWWRLAADLRRGGLRRAGRLVLDDGAFDRERWNPTWAPVGTRAYEAPIGALQANYGAVVIEVRPGSRAGAPVQVAVDPPVDALSVVVRAVTVRPGIAPGLEVSRERDPRGETIVVTGLLPEDAGVQRIARSVSDPTLYAGSVFAASLAANGIVLDERAPTSGETPPGSVSLLEFEGPTLAETVRRLLKYSSNPIAEGLVKALGRAETARPGSWESGTRALRRALESLGLDLRSAVLVDGSGLSLRDRVSPRLLVAALRSARDSFDLGPELLAALPVAGRDGTLQERASGAAGRVRAKTGTLTGVLGLSGFAQAADGEELVFSLLVNGARTPSVRGVDGFAEALARCSGGGGAG